eukprot:scaffold313179_cov17-Tisochrysis_lutea.AAC.1
MELDDGQITHTTTSKPQPTPNSTEDTAFSHQQHPPAPPVPNAGHHRSALIQATKDQHVLRLGLNTTLPMLLEHTQIAPYPHYALESHTLELTSPNNEAAALLRQARSITLTERGAFTLTMTC